MIPADRQRTVAIFPWGDVVEDFLEPIGLSLADFVERMRGGWLFGYVKALQASGVKATIVCASAGARSIRRYNHAETGASIWAVPAKRAEETGSPAAQSLRRWLTTPMAAYRRVLQEERCDALIVQEYEYARFDALALLARSLDIPLYATFQGGDCTLSWLEASVRRHSLRQTRALIVASARERARLAVKYPPSRLKIVDIPNPIDVEEWRATDRSTARKSLGLDAGAFIAINHGRIDIYRKGLDVLLQSWAEFGKAPSSQLVMVGSGQDRERFSTLLGSLAMENVRWVPEYTTDRALIRTWLSAADVYVSASRIEGMPVAPLEAMACGLPVVATDAQGIPDIFADGIESGGLVVRGERPDAIAAALSRLKEDAGFRTALGGAGRRTVERRFSIGAVGAALSSLINDG